MAAALALLLAAILAASAGAWLRFGTGAGLARRAQALCPAAAGAGPAPPVQPTLAGLAQRLFRRTGRLEGRIPGLRVQLGRAGWRGRHAPSVALLVLLVAPLSLAVLALLAGPALRPGTSPLAGALAGLVAGLLLPILWLRHRIAQRQAAVRSAFPDFLDLLVICVEAGLSLDAALKRVARELAPAAPVLADEIGLTAIELGLLPDRAEAFANLVRRVDVPDVRALLALVQQTERYGTPLSAALRVQAAEGRTAALLRVEERAARLPVLLTVPMILFILPPLFIILIGPVALQLLAR